MANTSRSRRSFYFLSNFVTYGDRIPYLRENNGTLIRSEMTVSQKEICFIRKTDFALVQYSGINNGLPKKIIIFKVT
jgi:hypothetical protein